MYADKSNLHAAAPRVIRSLDRPSENRRTNTTRGGCGGLQDVRNIAEKIIYVSYLPQERPKRIPDGRGDPNGIQLYIISIKYINNCGTIRVLVYSALGCAFFLANVYFSSPLIPRGRHHYALYCYYPLTLL